jgi:hypothetical protein
MLETELGVGHSGFATVRGGENRMNLGACRAAGNKATPIEPIVLRVDGFGSGDHQGGALPGLDADLLSLVLPGIGLYNFFRGI